MFVRFLLGVEGEFEREAGTFSCKKSPRLPLKVFPSPYASPMRKAMAEQSSWDSAVEACRQIW